MEHSCLPTRSDELTPNYSASDDFDESEIVESNSVESDCVDADDCDKDYYTEPDKKLKDVHHKNKKVEKSVDASDEQNGPSEEEDDQNTASKLDKSSVIDSVFRFDQLEDSSPKRTH